MDMKKLTKLVIGVIALALIIAAVVFVVRLVGGLITGAFNLVLAIGISYSGSIQIGIVSLSGLAVASIVGIALNAILPGKDYVFEQENEGSTSVDLSGAINMDENQ